MSRRSLLMPILAVALLTAFNEPDEGIMDVFDNFSASNSVASRCRPEGSVYKNFVSNYQLVSQSAALYLKQKTPTFSDAFISAVLTHRYESIDAKVAQVIAQEGCDGLKIRPVMKQFEALAVMDPANRKRKRPPQN